MSPEESWALANRTRKIEHNKFNLIIIALEKCGKLCRIFYRTISHLILCPRQGKEISTNHSGNRISANESGNLFRNGRVGLFNPFETFFYFVVRLCTLIGKNDQQ
jgi:hypothetical protein